MASSDPKEPVAQKSAAAQAPRTKEGPTTDRAVNRQINDPQAGVTRAAADPYNEDGTVRPTDQRSKEQDATDEAFRRQNDPDAEPFISEGMRHDLETIGECNDPITGRRLTMKDGDVTAHPREEF